ncbi:MAG: 30S ribosomal protein S11 [Candidatus Magasanikbacteria bacterium]
MGKKQVVEKSEEEAKEEAQRVQKKRAKHASQSVDKRADKGRVYIRANYNNTHVTVTDMDGDVIAWVSAGSLGFSGPKKATPFAASKVGEAIADKLEDSGPFDVEVYVKGIGSGRNSVLKTLNSRGFNIQSIKDITPIPHNGPRPPKERRV